jgi:hypothetical protein
MPNKPFALDQEMFEDYIPKNIAAKKLEIDLRRMNWVFPSGLNSLYLLLRYRISIGMETIVHLPKSAKTVSYLYKSGFFRDTYDSVEFIPDPSPTFDESPSEDIGLHGLTQIRNQVGIPSMIGKFKNTVKQQWTLNEAESFKLESCMLELIQNIPDHSQPEDPEKIIGYAVFQYYSTPNILNISFGDIGVGIKNSLMMNEQYKEKKWADSDAIELVMTERITRFQDEPLHRRGGGFRRAVEHVIDLNGKIEVRSGTEAVWKGPNLSNRKTKLQFFPGTQISIEIGGKIDHQSIKKFLKIT